MKTIKKNLTPLLLMLIIPLVNIFYTYTNNSFRGVHSLTTDLDKAIPFLKVFIVPYLIWYPFIIVTLVYLCIKHRKIYYKVLSSLIIGMLLSYIVYFFFQTTVLRPQLTGQDLITNLVRFVYNTDNPFNCFPSIHVLTTYLMMKGIRKSRNRQAVINISVYLIGILIILATQFVKQHVILDVIFAILLAEGIYKIVEILSQVNYNLWLNRSYSICKIEKEIKTAHKV